jgi:hypothetical protein
MAADSVDRTAVMKVHCWVERWAEYLVRLKAVSRGHKRADSMGRKWDRCWVGKRVVSMVMC